MLNKIMAGVIVLGLCSHGCLAQPHKPLSKPSSAIPPPHPAPLDISPWLYPAANRQLSPTSFPQWTTQPQAWDPLNTNWGFTELTLKLAGIQRGLPLRSALLWLRALGGIEDGGVQYVPATRYYFKPGIMVYVPGENGYVTGPAQISLGQFHTD